MTNEFPRTGRLAGRIVNRVVNTGGIDPEDEVLGLARNPRFRTTSEAVNRLVSGSEGPMSPDENREIYEWVSALVRSSRSDQTGAETSNLQELYNSPYGARISQILENQLEGLRETHVTLGKTLNSYISEIDRLEQARTSESITDSEFWNRQRDVRAGRSSASRTFRNSAREIEDRENILDLMRGYSPGEGLRQSEDPHLLRLAQSQAGYLEKRGIPVALQNKIREARRYYTYRDQLAKSAEHINRYNDAFEGMVAQGINPHKMPATFVEFLKSISITSGAPYNSIINDYVNELTTDSRSTIAAQRLLRMGSQNTADFYKLYGLGALPTGAQEMGNAILASTGNLAGNEVRLVQDAFAPTFTNTSLWERTIDGGWQLSAPGSQLPYNAANAAVRLRPRGFASTDPAQVSFSLASEPQEFHSIQAFKNIDSLWHQQQAWKGYENEESYKRSLRITNALDEVNTRYGAVIQRHIANASDSLNARGALSGLSQKGVDVFSSGLNLALGTSPTSAAEEIMTGLLYGNSRKDDRYIRMLHTAMRGETPFAQEVGSILRETAPDVMDLGIRGKQSELGRAIKDWGNRIGVGHSHKARMAEVYRTNAYRNAVDREVNANYRIDRPAGLPNENWLSGEPLVGITANGESFMPALPYEIDTDQGTSLRQAALKAFRRTPEKRDKMFASIRRNRGDDFATDVENLVVGMDQQAEVARSNLERGILSRAANLRSETTNPESLAHRMNRLRRDYPQYDNPEGQASLLQKAKEEIRQEAQDLNTQLEAIRSGGGLSSEDESRIARSVHSRMIQSANIEDEVRRIENDASLSPKQIEHTTRNLRSGMLAPSASYGPGSRTLSFQEKFMQHLGTPQGLSQGYQGLGDPDAVKTYTDFIEDAYDRDPFVGKTASSTFQRLDQLVGSTFDVSIPGYEENYRRLFGTSQSLNLRLRSISPLGSNINSAPDRVRATFETVSELNQEDKERQLAAYFLPDLMQGWANDPIKASLIREEGGRLSDAAQREALGRARETLVKSNGLHTISQELEWQNFIPETSDLSSAATDFVRSQVDYEGMTINGQSIPRDDFGTYLTDDAIRDQAEGLVGRVQDQYGREALLGRLTPVENTSSMDEVQRLSRVRFLQKSALSGPNIVTNRRHAENQAILNQVYGKLNPEELGIPGVTVSKIMNSHIGNIDYAPFVEGERLGSDVFDEAISSLDQELQARGLSWQMAKEVSNNFRNINIKSQSPEIRDIIRDVMGVTDQDDWLNAPLARGNLIHHQLGTGEEAIEEGAQMQTLFANLVVNSRLNREMADDLFKDEEGNPLLAHLPESATRDEIAEEIYNLAGIDMRVSTPQGILADFISKRVTGILDPRMDAAYNEERVNSLNQLRTKYGLKTTVPIAQDTTEAIEDLGRTPVRLWRNPVQHASEFWHLNKINKIGLIGAAAFVAAGMIHGHIAKERTEENMQGPANLPGGNPYQNDPAIGPALAYGAITPANPSSQGGVEYMIRASGGMDPNKFQDSVSTLLGTNTIRGSSYDYPSSAGVDRTDSIYNTYAG